MFNIKLLLLIFTIFANLISKEEPINFFKKNICKGDRTTEGINLYKNCDEILTKEKEFLPTGLNESESKMKNAIKEKLSEIKEDLRTYKPGIFSDLKVLRDKEVNAIIKIMNEIGRNISDSSKYYDKVVDEIKKNKDLDEDVLVAIKTSKFKDLIQGFWKFQSNEDKKLGEINAIENAINLCKIKEGDKNIVGKDRKEHIITKANEVCMYIKK